MNQRTVKPLPLRNGAVIGAGTMGTGIAMCMLNIGMPVILVEQSKEVIATIHKLGNITWPIISDN